MQSNKHVSFRIRYNVFNAFSNFSIMNVWIVVHLKSGFNGIFESCIVVSAAAIDLSVEIVPIICVAVVLIPHLLYLFNVISRDIS